MHDVLPSWIYRLFLISLRYLNFHNAPLVRKTQWKEVFSLLGSQINCGYITMRQMTSRIVMYAWLLQNQNQNCYWWHVQMTIIHQDLWWGKLVPCPCKRSELSNRVFCYFSSRKESICKWIPITNSLGEEAALVNVSISEGGLKCQRVVISEMPNWGDKVIHRYTGCTLQTFVKHYNSTISPPFFQRFPL